MGGKVSSNERKRPYFCGHISSEQYVKTPEAHSSATLHHLPPQNPNAGEGERVGLLSFQLVLYDPKSNA